MILQHHQIWGSTSQEVNTEIGGLGATITTKMALANLLEIPESNIGVFKIIGDDIHCQMKVNYNIPENKIGDRFKNPPPHPEITSYLDKGRRVIRLGTGAFSNCVLLTDIEFANINYLGHSALNNTRIKRADFSYLPATIDVGGFGNAFSYNPALEYVNTGNLETPMFGTLEQIASGMFLNCNNPNLQVITKLKKYGSQMFENTNIPEYINPYVTLLGDNSMRYAGFRKFEGVSVEYIGVACFFRPEYRNLEEVITPNAITVRSNAFRGERMNFSLLDIRRATSLDAQFLYRSDQANLNPKFQTGAIIKIDQSQSANADILWAKAQGATIQLHNNGNYTGNL